MPFRLRWPTEFGVITQKFGARPDFYKKFGLPGHEGLDFKAPDGSKVFACADGEVSEVRPDGGKDRLKFPYGNQVRIVHKTAEGEFTTVYAHLQSTQVKAGDKVKAGDLIGLADNTGNSDGAHLHLTLKKKGATAAKQTTYPNDIIDPTPVLDAFAGVGTAPSVQHDDLKFQADVTVPDNTIKNPGEAFDKTWRVLNNGTTTWGSGYKLSFVKDEQMGAPASVALPPAKPGEAAAVTVPLTAPQVSGDHRSTWRAQNPNGDFFGTILFTIIKVPAVNAPKPLNAILDLSHHNTVKDLQAARDDGATAVIHKATQGLKFVDKKYQDRRAAALALGLLWGAYHFGEGGDPVGQAKHFLDTAQPDAKTLVALDFERNPLGKSMNLTEAEQFAEHIHTELGRWPVFYTGRWYMREFLDDDQTTILSNCPLWVASYLESPSLPAQWPTWTLWQYTNGVDGPEPHKIKGIAKCDRNKFGGTLDDLKKWWGK